MFFLEQPRRGKSSVARDKVRGTSAATPGGRTNYQLRIIVRDFSDDEEHHPNDEDATACYGHDAAARPFA